MRRVKIINAIGIPGPRERSRGSNHRGVNLSAINIVQVIEHLICSQTGGVRYRNTITFVTKRVFYSDGNVYVPRLYYSDCICSRSRLMQIWIDRVSIIIIMTCARKVVGAAIVCALIF